MAITSTQKTEILKIVAGLFNAAPGGSNLTELANLVSGGMTTSQLADALAANTLFTNGIMGGKVTVEDQAVVLAHNFGLAADSDPASAGSQAVAYFTQLINDGVGFGNIVIQAITYLSGTPATEFTQAATLLANKVLVSDAYSQSNSSSDLGTLQNVLSKVTGTAPYTDAEVANVIGGIPSAGHTFTLTTGQDYADTTSSFKNGGLLPSDFKFTSGSDTVSAGAGTVGNTDALVDGSTTDSDTLNATLTSGAVATPTIQNVENVKLTMSIANSGLDFASVTGVKAVSVTGTANGVINNLGLTAGTTLAVNSYGKALTVQAATLAGTTALGTAEALGVTVSGTTKDSSLTIASATSLTENLESLTITSSGAAANILTLANGTNTVNIDKIVVAGAADLDLRVTSAGISGNTMTAADHAGVLTLTVNRNGTAGTTNLGNVSGVDNYVFRDSTAGGDNLVVSNLANGSNVTLATAFAGTDSITVKGAAANTANTLNVTIDNETDLTDTTIGGTSLTIADIETIGFTSAGATSAGGNTITDLIATSAATINVTGDSKLALGLDATTLVTKVNLSGAGAHTVDFTAGATYAEAKTLTLDGSTATGKLTLNGSDFAGTAGGVLETLTINGGSNDDTITGTSDANAKNVIDAGAGKDTVSLSGINGASVTLGDGIDTLSLTSVVGSGAVKVADFTLGTGGDIISVNAAGAMTLGTAGAVSVSNQLVVITSSVVDATAAKALVSAGAAAEAAILVIDDATGVAELWYDADGTAGGEVLLASFENITTVGSLQDFSSANFGTWA
ncbi:hypothetical protein [Nitrosomonas sp.]|uniref:beta strand repeat-containing protein n=1 Tax=Nitrosomonas sp. TaxID=42353 RepID=UPI0025E7FC4E|nr:hypothetical protein [Nitrosomonas sp.]